MKFIVNKISSIDVFIGKNIRSQRSRLGWSQEKLGELVGLTFQQIHKYELGLNRISAGKLYEIAQIMEKPMSIFFNDFEDDDLSYSFKPMNEDKSLKKNIKDIRQLKKLIANFNGIKSLEIKKNLVNLVKSLSGGELY